MQNLSGEDLIEAASNSGKAIWLANDLFDLYITVGVDQLRVLVEDAPDVIYQCEVTDNDDAFIIMARIGYIDD